MSSMNGEMRIDAVAASARLADFFRGYMSTGGHGLQEIEPAAWQRAAREEFLRRRLKLITALDDELLLAIGLGFVDVAAVAHAVRAAAGEG